MGKSWWLLSLLVAVSCGETQKVAPETVAEAGEGGAETSAGAGGTAGRGGTASGGRGGLPSAEAGAGSTGFEPGCGGELLDSGWMGTSEDAAAEQPMGNPCSNLELMAPQSEGDTFHAATRVPLPAGLDYYLRFDDDGYRMVGVRRGEVSVTYPAICLSTVSVKPTCEELAVGLVEGGVATRAFTSAACETSAEEDGGCDCVFQVVSLTTDSGTFSVAREGVVTLASTTLNPSNPPKFALPFCVEDDRLELAGDAGKLWPHVDDVDLSRVDCGDGEQGYGELGADCGWACPADCDEVD